MPYKKKPANARTKQIILIAGIALTAIALIAAAFFAVYMHNKNEQEKAKAALAALPRIVIPEGHFELADYTPADVQKEVKAVSVKAGVDFYTDENADSAVIQSEINKIVSDVKSLDFNSIILHLNYDDKVIYRSSVFESIGVDMLTMLYDAASAEGITISAVFDMQGAKASYGEIVATQIAPSSRETLVAGIEELCRRYNLESLILDNYYLNEGGINYAQFASYGADGIYDEWLKNSMNSVFKEVVDAAKAVKSSLPIGLWIDDVWATADAQPDGCAVAASFQAYTDGHADTKGLIEDGVFDFVNVKIDKSLIDPDQPFETIADYWGAICRKSAVPMYVTHSGEKIVNQELVGWNGTDELSRQVLAAVKSGNYYGSIFTGLSRLIENPEGSTEYLLKYLRDEIKEDEMLSDLDITLPTKKSFVTYEEEQQFRMSFDPNAEVYLNGEPVIPSERGGASVWVPLDVGVNKIVLEHKGKSTTFTIERKVIILDSVSPTAQMKVGGNSSIYVNVVAYKGSVITATLNGQTITLEEGGGGDEITETKYVNYEGVFTAPKATAKEQDIGKISFAGSYMGYNEYASGSHIIVDKIPDEAEPDSLTGTVLEMAVVNSRYANVYPFQSPTTYPEAVLYQLPLGTQDIVLSRTGEYLNLRSGKTIHQNMASVEALAFDGNNAITDLQVSVEDNDTVIRMTMNWCSPFSITPSPYPSQGVTGKKNYYFAADTITLTMDYVTFVAENAIEDMSSSSLFSSMSHKLVKNQARNINQMQFTLPLSQTGAYYGCHAEWDGNTLVLRFNQRPDYELSGMTIVIDPGHGGTDNGNMAGRDIVEKVANLNQAEYVKSALESYGANVIMTRNNDATLSLAQRVELAHAYGADLFISVHHNSVGSDSRPQGPQTYFNTPFSQPLAAAVQSRLDNVMPDSGWNFWSGYNFQVARERQFPSILIECGFLSNPYDESLAQDDGHLQQMAEAIARGVVDYYTS